MVGAQPVDDLGILVVEGLRLAPPQLVDAQHHIDLAKILFRHGVQQGHFPRRSIHSLREHGLHRGAHGIVIRPGLQPAVHLEPLRPGIPQKRDVIEICILHRFAFRDRGKERFLL